MSYSQHDIDAFYDHLNHWLHRESQLTVSLSVRSYQKPETWEFVMHGLVRRVATLKHSLRRVFEILPPSESDPSQDALLEATTHLQAFLINVFGAIDNLARVWVMESDKTRPNGRPFKPMQIGLTPGHAEVRRTLSKPLQGYLTQADPWFGYLEDYRHALAHRVPLYIPPRRLDEDDLATYQRLGAKMRGAAHDPDLYLRLTAEQRQLGIFVPLMMHSYAEAAQPVQLHPQMIYDFSTVIEISEHMLKELDSLPPK